MSVAKPGRRSAASHAPPTCLPGGSHSAAVVLESSLAAPRREPQVGLPRNGSPQRADLAVRDVARARGAVVLAGLGLVLAGLLGSLVVLYANVPPGYDIPYRFSLESPELFHGLWPYPRFALEASAFGRLAALGMLAAWGSYLLAWWVVSEYRTPDRRQVVMVIAAFAVLYHLALVLFMSPVLSSDVYHYILFGRMVALYGLNPYVTTGAAIQADPFFDYAGWQLVTSHYGPLWTLLSAGAAGLGGENVLVTTLLFKALAALFSLANCLLVFLLARRLTGGDGTGALLLYAWNPLILLETAGSGHNDAVMMTFALLGLLLATRGRLLLALTALALSVLLKYLSALLLLFFVVRCLAHEPSRSRAMALGAKMGALGALVAVALYLPFWAGPDAFERLLSVGAPFKSLVRILLRDRVAALLTSGGDVAHAQATAEALVIGGLHLAFALLVLALARLAGSRRADWPRVVTLWSLASLVYMSIVYGWNLPWLLIPTLTTACLTVRSRWSIRLLGTAHAIGLQLMLRYALLMVG